jgi:hypothetical protein
VASEAVNVFISHSGDRSRTVADALANWLPLVLNNVEPWISTEMEKGTRWAEEINAALDQTGVGIICLTSDNLHSTWIHWEAGALARAHQRVWTFLLDLEHSAVEPPLSQFQHTVAQRDDVRRLLGSMNLQLERAGDRPVAQTVLDTRFGDYWERLEDELQQIARRPASDGQPARRSVDSMFEEILALEREQSAFLQATLRASAAPPVSLADAARAIETADAPAPSRVKLGPVGAPRYVKLAMPLEVAQQALKNTARQFGVQEYALTGRPAGGSVAALWGGPELTAERATELKTAAEAWYGLLRRTPPDDE